MTRGRSIPLPYGGNRSIGQASTYAQFSPIKSMSYGVFLLTLGALLVLVPRDAHEEAFSWQGSLGLAGFSGPEYRAGLRRLVGKEPGPDT